MPPVSSLPLLKNPRFVGVTNWRVCGRLGRGSGELVVASNSATLYAHFSSKSITFSKRRKQLLEGQNTETSSSGKLEFFGLGYFFEVFRGKLALLFLVLRPLYQPPTRFLNSRMCRVASSWTREIGQALRQLKRTGRFLIHWLYWRESHIPEWLLEAKTEMVDKG